MSHAADRLVRTYSGACAAASISRVTDGTTESAVPRRADHRAGPAVPPRRVGLVSSLSTQDITVLLTTQYLEEADVLSDSIVILDSGRVIASGTADDLKRRMGFSYCK